MTASVRYGIELLTVSEYSRHAGLDPASRKALDSKACPGFRSGVRRNDGILDNCETVNTSTGWERR